MAVMMVSGETFCRLAPELAPESVGEVCNKDSISGSAKISHRFVTRFILVPVTNSTEKSAVSRLLVARDASLESSAGNLREAESCQRLSAHLNPGCGSASNR